MNYRHHAVTLLKEMTLREKIGQISQGFYGFLAFTRDKDGQIQLTEEFKAYVQRFGGVGMLNNYFRYDFFTNRVSKREMHRACDGIRLEEREAAYNVLQKYLVENTRLGIPALIEEDSPHGRCILDGILYPVSHNVGASFNPGLYEKQTAMIGKECKLGGCHVPYLSILDMAKDPRWGRTEECFTEDPYLASQFSAAATRGMKKASSMFCAKHFAAQGAAEGGHNQCAAVIGERELREIHLPPVKAAVEGGCDFLMAAYNEIDGIPCHSNAYLNNTILREELNFRGVLRSDASGVRLVGLDVDDMALGAAMCIKSGVDADLWDGSYIHLEDAIEKGYLEESVIDEAVIRVLEKKFQCGLMDHPYLEEKSQSKTFVESGAGQAVAYEMAAESLVLLKNENHLLPLQKSVKVLLIGENLGDAYHHMGDYTTKLNGRVASIAKKFTENGASYIPGWEFLNGITASMEQLRTAVRKADVVIYGFGGSSSRDFNCEYTPDGALVSGDGFSDCGEGYDLSSLEVTAGQKELLKMIARLGKPIVALGIGGRPYILREIAQYVNALIWCGYPGQEGARAIRDTVYGDKNSFGRLAVSFPKSVGQLPIFYNRKIPKSYVDLDAEPLFSFGYGLSYSEFEYSDMKIGGCSLEEMKNGGKITVTCRIKNVSDRTGMAVPQLYIQKKGGTVKPRLMELKGFAKLEIGPGEEKTASFHLGREEIEEWSVHNRYELFPYTIRIMIGRSSKDIILDETIRLN